MLTPKKQTVVLPQIQLMQFGSTNSRRAKYSNAGEWQTNFSSDSDRLITIKFLFLFFKLYRFVLFFSKLLNDIEWLWAS